MEPNRCFTSPPEVHRPCRQVFFWIPRTCVLQCLGSWAIKNVVFSYVWGVMAPMGKLVTCLGRLGRQNRIKGSRRVRLCRRSGIRSVPNLWFSSVCYAWANKTWCFAMVDGSGRSTAVVKPYSRTLAHQITTLGAPLLCGQAIFETPGASNHHSGRSTAVVKPYSRPMAHQITSFC